MRIDEILATPLLEMALSKKKAESTVSGLEDPVNTHLLKLAAVQTGAARAEVLHWRHELVTWLLKIARIKIKPTGRPAPAAFYYRILFDEPYGGAEEPNVHLQLDLLARDYPINRFVDSASIVARLRRFHAEFAQACAKGDLDVQGVEALVGKFGGVVEDQ